MIDVFLELESGCCFFFLNWKANAQQDGIIRKSVWFIVESLRWSRYPAIYFAFCLSLREIGQQNSKKKRSEISNMKLKSSRYKSKTELKSYILHTAMTRVQQKCMNDKRFIMRFMSCRKKMFAGSTVVCSIKFRLKFYFKISYFTCRYCKVFLVSFQ